MPFRQDLLIGERIQNIVGQVISRYHPYFPTSGKNDFDGHLFSPTGPSVEIKFDPYSLASQNIAIEHPTILKSPDILIQVICYAKAFTRQEYEGLYMTGKSVLMGDQLYDGRLIPKTYIRSAPFLDAFLKTLQ